MCTPARYRYVPSLDRSTAGVAKGAQAPFHSRAPLTNSMAVLSDLARLRATQSATTFRISSDPSRALGIMCSTCQNVLDREPDASRLAYHLNDLAHGVSRAEILSNFFESPEN
jgi:hypothetical protein